MHIRREDLPQTYLAIATSFKRIASKIIINYFIIKKKRGGGV